MLLKQLIACIFTFESYQENCDCYVEADSALFAQIYSRFKRTDLDMTSFGSVSSEMISCLC